MFLNLRTSAIATMVLALAACGGGNDKGAGRTAEGQVLEGSASDAMLPVDTVRSQAPLAPHEGGGASDKAKTDDSADQAASDAPAEAPADETAEPEAAN